MAHLPDHDAVDWPQWRSLCRAYVLIDYAALFDTSGDARRWRQTSRSAVRLLIGLAAMGSPGALAFWLEPGVFLASLLVATTTVSLVGSAVLTRSSMVVAPDDVDILGFRPVNSRTYFAVRVTTLLVQTLELALLSGALPVVVFLARPDSSWAAAAAALAMIVASAFGTTLLLVVLHAQLLRRAPLQTVLKWSAQMQVAFIWGYLAALLFVGALVARLADAAGVRDLFDPRAVEKFFESSSAILWFPPAWFASYVSLAERSSGLAEWTAALLSVALLIALGRLLSGSLAADYSARLRDTSPARVAPRAIRQGAPAWMTGEVRAVFILARSEWQGNHEFRQRVVSAVALSLGGLGYVAFSYRDLSLESASARQGMLALQIFVAVLSLRILQSFRSTSESAAALWMFLSSPADPARLIAGARQVVTAFVLLPVMATVAILLVPMTGSVRLAGVYVLLLGGVSYVVLQLTVLANPVLPFSRTTSGILTGQHRLSTALAWVAMSMYSAIVWSASRTETALIRAALATCALALILDAVGARAISRRSRSQYEGAWQARAADRLSGAV